MAQSSADLAGDGFSAERLFSQGVSYTYDDVILYPGFIDFPADAVDLSAACPSPSHASPPPWTPSPSPPWPPLGGGAVVHCNTEPHIQASIVRAARSRRVPFVSSVPFFSPASAPSRNDFAGHDYAVVTERGDSLSRLVGVAVAADAASSGAPVPVSEYMRPAPRSASADFEQAAAFLSDLGLDHAPLVPPK